MRVDERSDGSHDLGVGDAEVLHYLVRTRSKTKGAGLRVFESLDEVQDVLQRELPQLTWGDALIVEPIEPEILPERAQPDLPRTADPKLLRRSREWRCAPCGSINHDETCWYCGERKPG